jgi:hypothetical protein
MSIALERALERLAFAEAAKKALVKLLELEPMGGRPGGRATWDDVIAYVAKLKGGHQLANSNIGQCTTNVHNSGERCVYGAFHPGECDA